jgi:hypothetical protein
MQKAMKEHQSMIIKITDPNKFLEKAADALRLFEMKGRVTLGWDRISSAQRAKWREKAKIVLDAADAAGRRS